MEGGFSPASPGTADLRLGPCSWRLKWRTFIEVRATTRPKAASVTEIRKKPGACGDLVIFTQPRGSPVDSRIQWGLNLAG